MNESTGTIEQRPQPIGMFPFPAASLLLPAVDDVQGETISSLMAGDVDIDLPRTWEFIRSALKGDIDTAIGAVRSDLLPSGELPPISIYNLFVLEPSLESYEVARRQLTGEIRELLDVAAYAAGVTDSIASEFSFDREISSFAMATSAAAAVESGDMKLAAQRLQFAVESAKSTSPILAATLISQLADIAAAMPGFSPALILQDYHEAIRLARGCKLPMLLPELHAKMGMILQNASNGQRGALLQAVHSYQAALQGGITEEDYPALFAQLQNNLGLAYLSMPATGTSDQLRNGIAVQSFRHALKVYTTEDHPDLWASVSMNLANALQYAPSSHPEENLIQAVETYDEVLRVRTREKDPVAYAIVLLNQANALAHLGMFKPALEKVSEAYKLFHWYEQIEQANAARELVEQINEKLGEPQAAVAES